MREYGYNLNQKLVKGLSELSPFRTAVAIAFDWAVIAAEIVFSEWMNTWWALILAWMVNGGRMHAMGVLIPDFDPVSYTHLNVYKRQDPAKFDPVNWSGRCFYHLARPVRRANECLS